MKRIMVGISTLLILTLLVALHGFYYDWLEFCEYNGDTALVFGHDNIVNYEYDQRLKQVKDFQTKESEHFIFFFPKDREFIDEDMKRMEEAYDLTSQFWGVDRVNDLGRKINFIWVPGETRYDGSELARLLGIEVQGMAKSSLGIMYSIFTYTPHELNHVISYQVGSPPTFLNEGFANYYNKVNWEKNVLYPLNQIRDKEALIPIEDLMESNSFRKLNGRITYPEVAMFVKFLVEEKGKDTFIQLYSSAKRDFTRQETIELMENIYGENFEILQQQWLKFLDTELENYTRPNI